jgi:ankyrin repeat protein
LHMAMQGNCKETLIFRVSRDPALDAKDKIGRMPIHAMAAGLGHKDVVEFLLANKADVKAEDDIGFTPLHVAACMGYKDIVELLLDHEAEVAAKDNNGSTPLHVAVRRAVLADSRDVAASLLSKGAEVNVKDKNGFTPLHLVGDFKDMEELLRSHGGHP